MRFWLFIIALIMIVIDQASKIWAQSLLTRFESIPVLPMLNWRLAYNQGAAFSFLAHHQGWQRWFLSGIAIGAAILLFFWIIRLKRHERFLGIGLALILSGAIGNVIDRIRLGYVIDFIDIYYKQYHWPTFNVADIAISTGVILMLASHFLDKPKRNDFL